MSWKNVYNPSPERIFFELLLHYCDSIYLYAVAQYHAAFIDTLLLCYFFVIDTTIVTQKLYYCTIT